MLKATRQKQICEAVQKDGGVSVAELAEKLGASQNTIRRDLAYLGKQGVLQRTHGGATFDDGSSFAMTPTYAARTVDNARQKQLIAKRSVEFVSDGASILLNGGTTMQAFAVALRNTKRDLQIVTNGLTVATELDINGSARAYFIGGVIDFTKMATVGQTAQEAMKDIQVEQAFLGVSGISITGGLAMFNPHEAEINRAFIQAAQHVTVLVDSSKFASKAMFRIASLDKIHRLVTDELLTDKDRRQIEALGIELIIVNTRD